MQPLSRTYLPPFKQTIELQKLLSSSQIGVDEQELIKTLRADFMTIGMIDEKGGLLFTPKLSINVLSYEGQAKVKHLFESEIPFCNKDGKKLLSMTQWEFILGFGKKCYSNHIPVTTFLRGGYAAFVCPFSSYLELLVNEFLECYQREEHSLVADIKTKLFQLKEIEEVASPPCDIDWLKITLNEEPNLWRLRSLLIEFVAEKLVCVKALEILQDFLKEKKIQDQPIIKQMQRLISQVKYFEDIQSLEKNEDALMSEFIKTRLDPSLFFELIESDGFINLLIPVKSPLFPLPANYLITSIGNSLNKHKPKTDLAVGSCERLFLFSRDDLRLNISNGFSRHDKVSQVTPSFISLESTDFFQMLIHRKLKYVMLESWHFYDFRAALTAVQLMLQGHILIEDKCSLKSIWTYAIKQSDPYIVYAIIERAKWHLSDSFSYLITCYLHLRESGQLPKEHAHLLKKAIKESLDQLSSSAKWKEVLIAFLDYPEALLLALQSDLRNGLQVSWDVHGEGILTVLLDKHSIIFPRGDYASFFKKNGGVSSHLIKDNIENLLILLAEQKKDIPLSQDFLDSLINYLVGLENTHERQGLAKLLDPWLKIKTVEDLSWIKALLSYVYQKGICLWHQTKGWLSEDMRLKHIEEIFVFLSKERPNTAFMQLGEENIPIWLRKKILYLLIKNPNTGFHIIEQITEEFFPLNFKIYDKHEADLQALLFRLKTKKALNLLKSFSPFSKTVAPIACELLLKAALESCELSTVLPLMQQINVRNCNEGKKISGWINASQVGILKNQKDLALLAEYFSLMRFYKVVEVKDQQIDNHLVDVLKTTTVETISSAILLFKACKPRFNPPLKFLDVAKHLFFLLQDQETEDFILAALKGYPQTKRTEVAITVLRDLSAIPETAFSLFRERVLAIEGIDHKQMLSIFNDEWIENIASKDLSLLMRLLEEAQIQKKVIPLIMKRVEELSERQVFLLVEHLKKDVSFSFVQIWLNRSKLTLKNLGIPILQEMGRVSHVGCQEVEFIQLWDEIIENFSQEFSQLIRIFSNTTTPDKARRKILDLLLLNIENCLSKDKILLLEAMVKDPNLFFDLVKKVPSNLLDFTSSFLQLLHEKNHEICQTDAYLAYWKQIFDQQDPLLLAPCFKNFSLMRSLYDELEAYVKTKKWIQQALPLATQKKDRLIINQIKMGLKEVYFAIESLKSYLTVKRSIDLDGNPELLKERFKQQIRIETEEILLDFGSDVPSKITNYTIFFSLMRQAQRLNLIDLDEHFLKLEQLFSLNVAFPFVDTIPFGFDLIYEHLANLDFTDLNACDASQRFLDFYEKRRVVLKNWIGFLNQQNPVNEHHVNFLCEKGDFSNFYSVSQAKLINTLCFSLQSSLIKFKKVKDSVEFRNEIRKKCLNFAEVLLTNKIPIKEAFFDPCLKAIDEISSFIEDHRKFFPLFIIMLDEWLAALKKKFPQSSILNKKIESLTDIQNNVSTTHNLNQLILVKKRELEQGLILYTEFLQPFKKHLPSYCSQDQFLKRGLFADLNVKMLHPIEIEDLKLIWAASLKKSKNTFDHHRANLLLLHNSYQISRDESLEYLSLRQNTLIQKLLHAEVSQELYNQERIWFEMMAAKIFPSDELRLSYFDKWCENMKKVFPLFPEIRIPKIIKANQLIRVKIYR